MKQSIYKPLFIFSSLLFLIGLLLWYSSPFSSLNWGEWQFYHHKTYLPILISGLIILTIFVFQREIKLAKTEQEKQDCKHFMRLIRLRNKDMEKEISILKDLITNYGLAQNKINEIWAEIKDKITLSQLYELPELAMLLIEKIVNIKDEFSVKLVTKIDGDISALKKVDVDDLRAVINLMLNPICNDLETVCLEQRSDINLFIREHENKISFKLLYDFCNNTIETATLEWRLKKILHKYNGNFSYTVEQEEDMSVFILTTEIPKKFQVKKII